MKVHQPLRPVASSATAGRDAEVVKQLSPSPEAVASILGISPGEVRDRLAARGLRRKRWTGTRLILEPIPVKKSAAPQPE